MSRTSPRSAAWYAVMTPAGPRLIRDKDGNGMVPSVIAFTPDGRATVGSAAKAHAVLRGRFHAPTRDVGAVAAPVLRHRILTTFNAEAAGITSDEIIRRLLTKLAPREDLKV